MNKRGCKTYLLCYNIYTNVAWLIEVKSTKSRCMHRLFVIINKGEIVRAIAYIDGFNFYFGMTYGTIYKWCNLFELCKKLVPDYDLLLTKMFAGKSKVLNDPNQPMRQNTYFRALETYNCGKLKIYPSSFVIDNKHFPRVDSGERVWIRAAGEKGADVKIATHLLVDAYNDCYDCALLLSNDSDLEEPIYNVRKVFNKKVIVFAPIHNPNRRMSDKLMRAAGSNNHSLIPFELVKECQLPNTIIREGKKDLTKPREWYLENNQM